MADSFGASDADRKAMAFGEKHRTAYGGGFPKPGRTRSTADTHQLKIAIDTVRMTPAMRGVMGGMTLAEACRYLATHGHCGCCGQRDGLPHLPAYHPQD